MVARSNGKTISTSGEPAGLDITKMQVKVTADALRIDVDLAKPFGSGITMRPGTLEILAAHLFTNGAEQHPPGHLIYRVSLMRTFPIDATVEDSPELDFIATSPDTKYGFPFTHVKGSKVWLDTSGVHASAPLANLTNLPKSFSFDAQTSAMQAEDEPSDWGDGCPAVAEQGHYLSGTPLPRYPQHLRDPGAIAAATTTTPPPNVTTSEATTTPPSTTTTPLATAAPVTDAEIEAKAARDAAVVTWTYGVTPQGYPSAQELLEPNDIARMESMILGPAFRNNDCTQIVSDIAPLPVDSSSPRVHPFTLALQRRCPPGITPDTQYADFPLGPFTDSFTVYVVTTPKPGGGWWATNAQLGTGPTG